MSSSKENPTAHRGSAPGTFVGGDNSLYNSVLAAYSAANAAADQVAASVIAALAKETAATTTDNDGDYNDDAPVTEKKIMLVPNKRFGLIASRTMYDVFLKNCERISAMITEYENQFTFLKKKISSFYRSSENNNNVNVLSGDEAMEATIIASNSSATGSLSALPALLKIPADVLGFFRHSDDYAGTTSTGGVEINAQAVQARVMRGLMAASASNIKVVRPNLMDDTSEALKAFHNVLEGTGKLQAFADLPTDSNMPGAVKGDIAALRLARDDITKEIEAFVTAVMTVPEGDKHSLIAKMVILEQMRNASGATHFLSVDVVSSGGSTITAKGPLSNKSPVHSGGVVITFTLVDSDGTLVDSDSLYVTAIGREDVGGTNPIKFQTDYVDEVSVWQKVLDFLRCSKRQTVQQQPNSNNDNQQPQPQPAQQEGNNERELNVEPQSFEPQSFEPESFEPQSFEPQNTEPQNTEPLNVDPQNVQPQTMQPRNLQRKVLDFSRFKRQQAQPQQQDQQSNDQQPQLTQQGNDQQPQSAQRKVLDFSRFKRQQAQPQQGDNQQPKTPQDPPQQDQQYAQQGDN